MIAPCSPLYLIEGKENPSHCGGLGTWVNDSSLLPLVCNSMVGEHLTGRGCGDLGELKLPAPLGM